MFVDQLFNPLNVFTPVVPAGSIVKAAISSATKAAKVAQKTSTSNDQVHHKSLHTGQASTEVKFLFPEGVKGINANDVQQGNISDCYFLSAVSALAHHRPEDIPKMIKANKNDTYTVTFPGAKYPITINTPKDGWQSGMGRDRQDNSNKSHYVQVLEKAFVEYTMTENSGTINSTLENTKEGLLDAALGILSPALSIGRTLSRTSAHSIGRGLSQGTSDSPLPQDSGSPYEHFKYGGFQHSGIEILTGNSVDTDILALTRTSTLISKVQDALSNDRIITASTVMAGSDDNNLSDDHVYSVIGYDSDKGTLKIRNPYGHGYDATNTKYSDNLNDGIFELTTEEFFDFFNLIAYEQN